jgi:acyl-CoA thioesterase II
MNDDRQVVESHSSVTRMLEIFDVEPVGEHRFMGLSDGGGRRIVDGSQLLAQAIVACSKTFPHHTARSAHAVFFRVVDDERPVWFDVDVLHEGRTFASAVVSVIQNERRCASVTVLMDIEHPDVIRHQAEPPSVGSPMDAVACSMPMEGRELRLEGVLDPNDPADVGPPILDAWLRYSTVPEEPALAKALIAHFIGHLSISTTMRAHAGIGTSMAHHDLSTGVIALSVTFHEPVLWDGWLLYHHESVQVGSGMAFVRGQVFTEVGDLRASFSQDAMIRTFTRNADERSKPVTERL